MFDEKVTDLDPATTPLTGAEIIYAVQGGVDVQLTAQDVADLGGGGASWGSITGTLSDQTDLQAALDALEEQITGTIDGGNAFSIYGGATTIDGGGA